MRRAIISWRWQIAQNIRPNLCRIRSSHWDNHLINDRRKIPVYHGNKVLAALFLAGFMVYGGGLYCFVLLVPPLTEEFHWSRAATSGLVTAFWLSAPLILLGGSAIKRFGAARLLIAGILVEAVCVALLSTVSTFGEMYLLRAAMGVGKVMFAVTLPYAVSRWFSRHYSLGLGIVWAGWHVGGMVLAPIAGLIIVHYGWRTACLAIAAGLLTIGLAPVLATKGPRSPREFGLGLDGDPPERADAAPERALAETPAGRLRDLLGSATFWLIALTTLFFYATYGGLLTHEAAVVEGAGFSPGVSSWVLGSTAGFAAVGGMAGGWLLDRFSVRLVGIAMHLLLLAGAISLLWVARDHSVAALIAYAACFGITIGGSDLYFVALLRRRFPKVSVAYSYSAWYFCEILTLLLAGPAAGRVFDLTGNYDVTLALLAGSAVLAGVLSLFVLRGAAVQRSARADARDAAHPVTAD
ncbi:MAG TPA: MFS transporter [Steroidobacteraceae bacterium]|nr:MFS transporter [Steroidobacteraceae bacterium]